MDESRLNRLREELSKARRKRDEWETKVKDLERRYKEAENTCIHDMVHAANMSPEQLAELIRMAHSGGFLPGINLDQDIPAEDDLEDLDTDDTGESDEDTR